MRFEFDHSLSDVNEVYPVFEDQDGKSVWVFYVNGQRRLQFELDDNQNRVVYDFLAKRYLTPEETEYHCLLLMTQPLPNPLES